MHKLEVGEGCGKDPPVLPFLPDLGVAQRHGVMWHLYSSQENGNES